MVDPIKVKKVCHYCGQKLRMNSAELNIDWESNSVIRIGQKNLLSWYFYCGCAEGKKWTWTLDKRNETWRYHDWEKNRWVDEKPSGRGFVFR